MADRRAGRGAGRSGCSRLDGVDARIARGGQVARRQPDVGVGISGSSPPRFSVSFKSGRHDEHTAERRQQDAHRIRSLRARRGPAEAVSDLAYIEDTINRATFDLRDKTALEFTRDNVDAVSIDKTGAPAVDMAKKGGNWRLSKPIDARADFNAVDSLLNRRRRPR